MIPVEKVMSTDQAHQAPSQWKGSFFMYVDFHYQGEMVARPSYHDNGNSFTDKTTFLFWDGTLIALNFSTKMAAIHNLDIEWMHQRTPSNSSGYLFRAVSPSQYLWIRSGISHTWNESDKIQVWLTYQKLIYTVQMANNIHIFMQEHERESPGGLWFPGNTK